MQQRGAGSFGAWLTEFQGMLSGGGSMDVPCGSCAACCRSGQLIPVDADEADSLAHLPPEDLAPMPGQPGLLRLLHDESGRCLQLKASGCAVYEHRPRACRRYDCRMFAAAGITPDEPLIAEAARRWRFSYETPEAKARHTQVRTAAVMLGFPGGLTAPASPTQHALAAIDGADELLG